MSDDSMPQPSASYMKNVEIGKAVVAHVNSGATSDAPLWDAHWHPDFVSVEGMGDAYAGRPAVQAKCDKWMSEHTIHGCKASGPYVSETGFTVKYDMDLEPKSGAWPRMNMGDVGIYTVKDGKVVREEFWYEPMGG